jgi:hypothetical protein
MTAEVIQLPTSAAPPPPAERLGLNLSAAEVQEAAGGYVYPARQLRELHARGFVLATIGRHGRVVLPRAHYDAVVSGQFRQAPQQEPDRAAPQPDREGLRKHFQRNRKK